MLQIIQFIIKNCWIIMTKITIEMKCGYFLNVLYMNHKFNFQKIIYVIVLCTGMHFGS